MFAGLESNLARMGTSSSKGLRSVRGRLEDVRFAKAKVLEVGGLEMCV